MTFARIDGGRVRSVKEAKLALGELRCPNCGKSLIMLRGTSGPDASGYVVHVRSRHCNTEFDVAFSPGPGWDRRPPEIGVDIAATEDPSTVVPEARFVQYFEQSMSSLAQTEPAPADPDEREQWETIARVLATDALGMALEVGKFARAAGRALPAEMAKAMPWLRAVIDDPHVLARGTAPPA